MKSMRINFLILIGMLFVYNAFGQKTINTTQSFIKNIDTLFYQTRIHYLDDFINRFNGKNFRSDLATKYHNRKDGILSLFDGNMFTTPEDSLYKIAEAFCSKVAVENVYLDKYKDKWFASINCRGTLNNKEVDFKMFLSLTNKDSISYKWTIIGIDGDIFNNKANKQSQRLYITSDNHEMNFMSVPDITERMYEYIDDYAKDDFRSDKLTMFFTLVKYNLLKIDYVSDLEFKFFTVPDYIFTVRKIYRRKTNAGWLITSIEPCDKIKETIITHAVGL